MDNFLPILLVSLVTYLTPMPKHAQGLFVYYGSDRLIRINAEWHGYDLKYYRQQCGISVMSPADIGKIVWLRVNQDDEWFGPCLAVDVSQRDHFYTNVYRKKEIVEVSTLLRDRFRFKYGSSAYGYAYVGLCPPQFLDPPRRYSPPLTYSNRPNPLFYPPPQQIPVVCKNIRNLK